MDFSVSWANDYLLLLGRCFLALVFAVSASTKYRRSPDEIKILAGLHFPAPATAEVLVGICETIGVLSLVFGFYTRLASLLLCVFIIAISFAVLPFWTGVDPPPVKAAKRNAFVANIAIAGGLICLIAAGPGRFSIMR